MDSTVKCTFPKDIDGITKLLQQRYPCFCIRRVTDSTAELAVIEPSLCTSGPITSPISSPRMILRSVGYDISYTFEVFFTALKSGIMTNDNLVEFFTNLDSMLPGSGYFHCPGIPKEYNDVVSYDVKSARKWGYPFVRLDHVNCLLWYVPTNQLRKMNRLPSCKYCTNLIYYLRCKVNQRRSLTEQQKKARLEPSSHCPIYSLSPASQSKRLRKSRITINRLKQRIPQLQTCNVMLNDESHYELLTLVSSIQKKIRERPTKDITGGRPSW